MQGAPPAQFFLPLIGGALALLCLWRVYVLGRRRLLVENLPTCKTTGVFIGLVELKGTAESEEPLVSYLAGQKCVHYTWSVQEHWSRTVTETYRDSKGNTRTRTRRESGWKTVANGGESISFYLQDDEGVVLVRPEGANIEPLKVFSETCGRLDPLYYGKGPPGAVMHSDHRRMFVEQAIPLHAPLYVMGQSRERKDIVAPEIAADKHAPMFLISTRTEEQVRSRLGWGCRGWTIFGLILCVAGLIISDKVGQVDPANRVMVYVLVALVFGGTAALGWLWLAYNGLVDLRQRVNQAWSQVDVQLKRRFDLIPNLMNVVTAARDHEANLQTELAEMRTQLTATPPGESGADYHGVKQTLIAIAERYPELMADTSFVMLQENLTDTEERIALARGYFNEIATHFNTRLEVVPERFVARMARMKPRTLMAAKAFERAPVKVELAN
jgi:hypothetical protein